MRGPYQREWDADEPNKQVTYRENKKTKINGRLRALFFYMDVASSCYLGFCVCLIITLLSLARLRAFLFYVKHASPIYLGLEFYSIINLLSPTHLRAFLFYVDLVFLSY